MTEREAVEKLKNMRLFMQLEDSKNECKFAEDDYKANEMAIQALEKQIAKPPELKAYRENEGMSENVYKAGYKKAIDEYTEYLKEIGKTGTDGWVPCFTPNSWKDDFLSKEYNDVTGFENIGVNRQNEMLDSESDRIAEDSNNVLLNRVCYARNSSGTFVIDLNYPIEQGIIERNIKFDDAVEIVERNEENE